MRPQNFQRPEAAATGGWKDGVPSVCLCLASSGQSNIPQAAALCTRDCLCDAFKIRVLFFWLET